LPQEQLQKVFEFVQSLQANSLFKKWDNISEEDVDFSENVLTDYLSQGKY
jgi:hypothetical protein